MANNTESGGIGFLGLLGLAFPRQEEFHRSRKKYRLFGGAAGLGKTKALLAEAMEQAREVAGSNTLLLRRSYPELEASVLTYFRRDVPRDDYLHYNEAKHVVTWKNGSTTKFGYCRNENDVYQYQGATNPGNIGHAWVKALWGLSSSSPSLPESRR